MSRPAKIREIETVEELNTLLSQFIRNQFTGTGTIAILEAGCGNKWPLDLAGLKYSLTGIDIDENGLQLRQQQEKDLDVAILGDLCTVELAEDQFDVVYSSYVLEHVQGADKALENFSKWLKPGGFMILKFPDRNSVFGFITRMLPFPVHVFYKKYVYRLPNAGKPGHGPFPTVYDRVLSRQGLHEFSAAHNLQIVHEYCTNFYLQQLGWTAGFIRPMLKIIEIASLQRLHSDYNNLVFILQKPHPSQ